MRSVLDDWASADPNLCFCRRPLSSFEEKENSVDLKICVPGIDRDDLELFSESRKLTVRLKEKVGGEFLNWSKISFLVPEKYDIESLYSKLERGVLTITLEKKEKTKFHIIK
jgi:HSP20 family molecular chaperone IbpA